MFKLLPKIMIFDSPCTAQAQKVVATCTAISTVPKISSIFWIQYLKLEPMSGHMWGWFCWYLFGEYPLQPNNGSVYVQNNSSLRCVWEMFDFFDLNVIFPARSLKWLKFILDSCCNIWRTSPETVSNRQPCDGIRCCFQCLGIWTGPAAFCTSSGWAPWRYCFSHSCGYSIPNQAATLKHSCIQTRLSFSTFHGSVEYSIPSQKQKNAFQACHEKCSTQIKGKSS